jgi:hypothetical protein
MAAAHKYHLGFHRKQRRTGLAQWPSAASRNQKILQKATKLTKTGENFAKNAECLEIALQCGAGGDMERAKGIEP